VSPQTRGIGSGESRSPNCGGSISRLGGGFACTAASDDEWDRIVDHTVDFLADQARLGRVVSYSDLNSGLGRRGHVPFDSATESDRNGIGAVLGDATQRTLGDSKTMLSAIVAYLDRNDAGPGFYKLAVDLGLLSNTATADDKLASWSAQVRAVHER
jgi:hypothetical protein